MIRIIALASLLLGSSAAYAQAKPNPEEKESKAVTMVAGKKRDRGESWNYSRPNLDLSKYRKLIVEQTEVSNDPGADFSGLDASDLRKYADITTKEMREELGKAIPIVSKPGPDTARLKVTLLGAEKTTGGVATATRATPMGFAFTAVKSLAGREGSFTGSVLYSLELTDSQTNELQVGAVRRMSPDPLDIPATVSMTETVKSVAHTTAKKARERLETLMRR